MKKKKFRYTAAQIEFLRAGYRSMPVHELTPAFNTRFGTDKTEVAIKSALGNHKIRCGRKGGDRLIRRRRLYTDEHEQFIRENCADMSKKKLTMKFNERFGTSVTLQKMKALTANRRINSRRTGFFEKGHTPWNAGTKGLITANKGSFKKGNKPANLKPIGSERICKKDGFVLIKVAEQNPYTGFPTRYKHKHVYVWEQVHGPVPEGMVVAFRDGDKLNIEIENLMLISRAELLRLNKYGYKDAPDDLKPSVLAIAKLEVKTFALTKK